MLHSAGVLSVFSGLGATKVSLLRSVVIAFRNATTRKSTVRLKVFIIMILIFFYIIIAKQYLSSIIHFSLLVLAFAKRILFHQHHLLHNFLLSTFYLVKIAS